MGAPAALPAHVEAVHAWDATPLAGAHVAMLAVSLQGGLQRWFVSPGAQPSKAKARRCASVGCALRLQRSQPKREVSGAVSCAVMQQSPALQREGSSVPHKCQPPAMPTLHLFDSASGFVRFGVLIRSIRRPHSFDSFGVRIRCAAGRRRGRRPRKEKNKENEEEKKENPAAAAGQRQRGTRRDPRPGPFGGRGC